MKPWERSYNQRNGYLQRYVSSEAPFYANNYSDEAINHSQNAVPDEAARPAPWQRKWGSRALHNDALTQIIEEKKGDFLPGVTRGVDQVQGMLGGFLEASGEGLGVDGLTRYGREIRESNKEEAAANPKRLEFTDISSVGDGIDWLQATIAESIPQVAPGLLGAGGGAALGAGIGSVVPVLGTAAGATIGGLVGAFLPNFALGVGEVQGEIKDLGGTAPAAAFVGGSAVAALDSVLPGKIGGKLVKKFGFDAAEEIAKKGLMKEVAKDMTKEAITEGMQGQIGKYTAAVATDTSYEPKVKDIINEMAAGAVGAGTMTSAGATASYIARKRKNNKTLDALDKYADDAINESQDIVDADISKEEKQGVEKNNEAFSQETLDAVNSGLDALRTKERDDRMSAEAVARGYSNEELSTIQTQAKNSAKATSAAEVWAQSMHMTQKAREAKQRALTKAAENEINDVNLYAKKRAAEGDEQAAVNAQEFEAQTRDKLHKVAEKLSPELPPLDMSQFADEAAFDEYAKGEGRELTEAWAQKLGAPHRLFNVNKETGELVLDTAMFYKNMGGTGKAKSIAVPAATESQADQPAADAVDLVSTQTETAVVQKPTAKDTANPAFSPTHEMPDGAGVVKHPEDRGVWIDESGDEWIADDVTEIKSNTNKTPPTISSQEIDARANEAATSPKRQKPESLQGSREERNGEGSDSEAKRGNRESNSRGSNKRSEKTQQRQPESKNTSDKPGQSSSSRDSDSAGSGDAGSSIVARNYRISDSDDFEAGGAKTKAKQNIAAIKIAKSLQAERRLATEQEKTELVKYAGWGAGEYVRQPPQPSDVMFRKTPAKTPNKGMSVSSVSKFAKEWLESYNGNIPLDIVVKNQADEIYGPGSKASGIKGAYHSSRRKIVLIASALRAENDARETLRHEVLGHYGLNTFKPREKKEILDWILSKKKDPSLEKYWKIVSGSKEYSQLPDRAQAEEVFAHIAEELDTIPRRAVIGLLKLINKFLRAIGLADKQLAYPVLRESIRSIAKGIRKGTRKQQTFPKSDQAQFKRKDKLKPDYTDRDHASDILSDDADVDNSMSAKLRDKYHAIKDRVARRESLALLTRRQLVDVSKKYIPRVKDFLRRNEQMDADRTEWQARAGEVTQKWTKLSSKERRSVARVMHASTVAGVDPSEKYKPSITDKQYKDEKEKFKRQAEIYARTRGSSADAIAKEKELDDRMRKEPGRKAAYHSLVKAWSLMTDTQKEVYIDARDYHKELSANTLQALVDRIETSGASIDTRKDIVAQLRLQFESARARAPYFPLSRFGQFWVSVGENENRSVSFFETEKEAVKLYNKIKKESDTKVRFGKKFDDLGAAGVVPLSFVSSVNDLIADAKTFNSEAQKDLKDGIYQIYLESLPELSARKQNIHRHKVRGFSDDALRSFAKVAFHGAANLAKTRHGQEIQKTLDNLRADIKEAQDPEISLSKIQNLKLFRDSYIDIPYKKIKDDMGMAGRANNNDEHAELAKMLELAAVFSSTEEVEKEISSLEVRIDTSSKLTKRLQNITFATDVVSELGLGHSATMNSQVSPIATQLNQLGFIWYLGLTPAAAIINTFQVPMITLPVLGAKYGASKANTEVARAYKDYFINQRKGQMPSIETSLKGVELESYNELVRQGVIDKTQANDLAGMTEEGHQYSPTSHKVMSVLSFGFHHAEKLNREVTAIAAYRLAIKSGMSVEKSINYASDVTYETQFDYGSTNRARLFRGNTARVVTQFKQYSQGITYLYSRALHQKLKGDTPEAKSQATKALYGMLAAQFVVTGVLGMPLVRMLGMLTEGLVNALSGDDDDFDYEAAIRQAAAELAGKQAGKALTKGIFDAATPASLHGRLSVSELWFREPNRELEGRDAYWHLMEQALGPVVGGILKSAMVGSGNIAEGEYQRGIEQLLPKQLRDVLKSVRYQSEGGARTYKGSLIQETNAMENVLQAIGFTPSRVSDQYDQNSAKKRKAFSISSSRKKLIRGMVQAQIDRDAPSIRSYAKKITRFNELHDYYPISRSNINRSKSSTIRARRDTHDGVRVNRRLRGETDKYNFAD